MVILASASPRRRELLRLVLPAFEVEPAKGEELIPDGLPAGEAALFLATRKAAEILSKRPDALVIGSDTVVELDGEILGKPKDWTDAARMLKRLSGRTHRVHTGVAILERSGPDRFISTAEVDFCPLCDEEIRSYIESGEPMDKAGSYGIQGRGARFVSGIRGDFFTVMGLPVSLLYHHLKERTVI